MFNHHLKLQTFVYAIITEPLFSRHVTQLQALLVIVFVAPITDEHSIRYSVTCPLSTHFTQNVLVRSLSFALLGLCSTIVGIAVACVPARHDVSSWLAS